MRLWHSFVLGLVLPFALLGLSQQTPPSVERHTAEFRSMQQKLAWMKQNAARAHPDNTPVELTEPEVNAYFNEGGVKLPKGVSQVHLTSRPGVIDGHAHVDFEQVMQGRGSSNPLYSLFTGSHDVHVVADAAGVNGTASIKVESVALDDVAVPQWTLEFFVQRYLTPRYPNVGMTSTFKLPLRIDSAAVESGKVRLVQR